MWITLTDSFVSIVEHREDRDLLIVRGRVSGDVSRFLGLPQRFEVETPDADYRFRIVAKRETVERAVVRAVSRVNYPSFKDAVREPWRKSLAMRVWSIWYGEQSRRSPMPENQAPLFEDEFGRLGP